MNVQEHRRHANNASCCAAACTPPAADTLADTAPIAGARLARYEIANMDCPNEERLIRNKLDGMPGIVGLNFNLLQRVLNVHHNKDDLADVTQALTAIGMQAKLVQAQTANGKDAPTLATRQKLLLAVSGLAACAAEALAWTTHTDTSPPVIALALLSIAAGGMPTLRKGWIALKTLTLNINFLMSLAVLGAVAIGQWPEAAMVIFLFAVAELIESLSLDRVRNAVHGLLKLAPDMVTVRIDERWEQKATRDVPIGAVVRVKPGERIALDGVVVDGQSTVNQAPITGESMPLAKREGDVLYAGSINENGVLEMRVSSDSGNSTLAKIVRVIEETEAGRAPTQRFVDQFARYYTPAVVVLAMLVAALPPLAFGASFTDWFYKALVLLVIACPCALVISTPVTIVSGLTAAARRGILIKGGQYLEAGHKMKAIALDKTGTLTAGTPEVIEIVALANAAHADLLLLAASLNAHTDHPLARAIVAAGPQPEHYLKVRNVESLPGRGVKGELEGRMIHLGNHRLIEELGLCNADIEARLRDIENAAQSAILIASAEQVLGIIAVADRLRPTAAHAIEGLKRLGVAAVMLSGDNRLTAERIGAAVGITEIHAELLPQDKLQQIRGLQATHGEVGMLGDGINDAPALAQADIGFAMGAAGSDTAIETADVALMDDDLNKLPLFIELSRATRRVLVQNIGAALIIKAVFFALAVLGMATLWMAVFADVGASLLVVFNGLRLLRHANADARAVTA
ncbi:MAG TPA: heavy metal translocating P-type ATPase [Oxalicibacterium sp.]|nr:heavy metal translocating P-type ATPase [Oxalicibacterium sp.]